MILAALCIGALTAYYFGLRFGMAAAVASGVAFLVGFLLPQKLLWVYGGVAVYTVLVLFVGPRLPGRREKRKDFLRLARRWVRTLLATIRRVMK